MATKHRVLIPIFPGFNTLDANGPAEVLGNSAIAPEGIFSTFVTSATETTRAFENVTVKSDVLFGELIADGGKRLADYDMMVLPGGPPDLVQKAIDTQPELLDLINLFVKKSEDTDHEKWLISICTGAFFLAVNGLLAGKTVTTHWGNLEKLRQLCAEAASKRSLPSAEVVRKRWAYTGKLNERLALVTAGGVSCGIDAMLWVVSQVAGRHFADKISLGMDYDWKFSDIAVTTGQALDG